MAALSEVASLARRLMNDHGLGHVPFQYDRAQSRFGICGFASRGGQWRVTSIGLSEKFVRVNTIERCRDTILHEIAHALAGPFAHHGPAWKAQARLLGIKPERCCSHENTEVPIANYNAICDHCSPTKPVAVRTKAPSPYATYMCPTHKAEIKWVSANELVRIRVLTDRSERRMIDL